MTVAELIDELQKAEPDAPVWMEYDPSTNLPFWTITKVQLRENPREVVLS